MLLLLLTWCILPLSEAVVKAQRSASAADHRYVLFLSGICLDAPSPLFIRQISCGANPGDIDTPFMDTRDPHERTHTAFAAIRAAVTNALGLPDNHFLYYSYRAVNLRLPDGTKPNQQQINAEADRNGVFTCGFATAYSPSDTQQRANVAACALGAQIRAIRTAHPDVQIDLICHSLGGLVAATWLVDYAAPGMPDNDLLSAIHGMVTLDSPLQGVHNLKTDLGKGLNFGVTQWPIGADLNQDFAANRFNNFALGLLAVMPNLLTIGNYLDTFVTESDSWIGRYEATGRWVEDRDTWRNKVIADCAGRALTLLEVCHDVVLSNDRVLQWITAWLTNPGQDPEATTTVAVWAGTQDELQLAAYAYTTNRAGPAIQKVIFEFQYPAGSGPWMPVTCNGYGTQRIAGSDTSPNSGGLYQCLPGSSPDPGFPGVLSGAKVKVDIAVTAGNGEFKPHDGPRTITISMGEPPVHPGGVWVRPAAGGRIAAAVHFTARAYPAQTGDPAVGHVNFTVGWPASNPKQWKVACVATPPAAGSDLFSCDANLQQLGVPLGPVRVSFDVYDVRWIAGNVDHVHLAPDGERTFTYAATVPSSTVPGGLWIQPDDAATVGDVMHFAAHAYPTHQGDPAIDHVTFTVGWPAPNPAQWRVACMASPPTNGDVFSCDADLRNLGVQGGPIRVSFDVYDLAGNRNSAPNGLHTLTYTP
jgi:pimeloyl-ACP methyl ester carboxylesterase